MGSRILEQDMLEINLNNLSFRHLPVDNRGLMPALASQKCCLVFYKSRFDHTPHEGDPSNVLYKRLQMAVNFEEAEHHIKEEGVYFFGGRDASGIAQSTLLVMKVSVNANGVVSREYRAPETKGTTPPGRYMHTLEYYPEGNLVVMAGGRNEQLPNDKILNDLWVLKLNSLEWQRVILGGYEYFKQRFNFASVLLGSKLIVAGGIGYEYKMLKDY